MIYEELYCPLIKGNCIGQLCLFFDKLQAEEELTLEEQKGNCMVVRTMFELCRG